MTIGDTNQRAVRVFTQDESRIGLQTIRRRRITARGVKPVGNVQQAYANCWVYGCVAPSTGERFFLVLPKLNASQMQVFLEAFSTAHRDTFNVVVLDNSGAHTAKQLICPDNVALVFQPPYSPEVNPTERVWQDLKERLAWRMFADSEALIDAVSDELMRYEAATIKSLTGFPYLLAAINAVCS